MQTSNKILLGVFLAILLILTSIHVALYAKYKSGDFTTVDRTNKRIPLPPVKFVSATGLVNVQLLVGYSLVPNGQPGMEVERQPESRFAYRIVGDTLFLLGDSTAGKDAYEQRLRNQQVVQLSLPVVNHVKLAYGTLYLFGGLDSAQAPSYSIELAGKAHLGVVHRETPGTPVFFNRLDLSTTASNVELDEGTVIKELNVQSRTSTLIFKQSNFGHLSLDVDSATTITLLGKSLKDVHVIAKP